MGLFSFAKSVGEKIFGKDEEEAIKSVADKAVENAKEKVSEPTTQQIANTLVKRVTDLNLDIEGLEVFYHGDTDKVVVNGQTKTQADREKVILALGNVQHVATVEDNITVEADEPESQLYEVKSGDNLSSIAKEFYGKPDYMKIFEANKPMLTDPDKIYVGQTLRIPA